MARTYPDVYVESDAEARRVAKLGLDVRAEAAPSNRCCLTTQEAGEQGIGSGIARARDIIAGKRVNAMQVKGYFSRHEGYYEKALAKAKAEGIPRKAFTKPKRGGPAWEFAKGPHGKPVQGWWIWGGDTLREDAIAAVEAWRDEQESEARKLANPRWSCCELDTDLALLDPPRRIDYARVERIAAVMVEEQSWGGLPPVRAFLGVVTLDHVIMSAYPTMGPLWARPLDVEDVGAPYLHLVGGGTHRTIAATRYAHVPIRFRLAFERSRHAVDDRALRRRLTSGWPRK